MDTPGFELDAYLNRIGFTGAADVSLDTLERLYRAQIYTIPFENFDVLLGQRINLESRAVFDKLVLGKRGGYCFELNGLFLQALHVLGFDARALLARVHLTGTPSGRGHQLELITINGRDWIADVGFGGNVPCCPLPLELGVVFSRDGQTVRLADGGPFGIMLQADEDGQWKDLYSFDLGHVCPADIAYGNHYTSTSPDTIFTRSRVAALPVPGGRITLLDRILKVCINGKEEIRNLPDSPAYLDAVRTHFGIELDAPYQGLKPMPPEICGNPFH